MFAAEPAVFLEFKSVGIVLLVFLRVIVTLFAFAAGKSNLHSHFGTSLRIWTRDPRAVTGTAAGRSDVVPPSARGTPPGMTGPGNAQKRTL
jgi:hypothetical protein